MDHNTLEAEVRSAVDAKISMREPFTLVDISHPIIERDNSVRHKQVRAIVDQLASDGLFDDEMYTSSPITVYPSPSKPCSARLFHPDEPTFDINSYTATNQVLHRDGSGSSAIVQSTSTRNFDMTDGDGDDGSQDDINVITTTASGAPVTKQCYVQSKANTLNVPVTIVTAAGFKPGDSINVKNSSGVIQIEKSNSGKQKVDKEGRIRLHGNKIEGHDPASKCTAVVITPNGSDTYIQIQ